MNFNKSFKWNLVGNALPLLIGIIAMPFLINKIGMEVFGVLTLIWALIGYFNIFDLGLGQALTYLVSSNVGENRRDYIGVGIFLIFIIGVLAALILIFLINIFGISFLGVQSIFYEETKKSVLMAASVIPLATLSTGFRGVLEGLMEFKKSNIIKIFNGVSNFLFPLMAVVFFESNLFNLVVSLALVRVLVVFLSIYFVCFNCGIKLNMNLTSKLRVAKDFFKFGSWMTLSNIVSPLMVTSDRFFIASISGAAAVAYYSVPFEVAIKSLVIPAALTGVYFSHAARVYANSPSESLILYESKFRQNVFLMFFISLSLVIFSKIFLKIWIDEEFSEKSWLIMSCIGVGIFFNGIAQMPLAALHARGNTKTVALVHCVELLIYVPFLIIMITVLGPLGAAVAWLSRASLDFFLLFIYEKRTR